LVNIPEDVAQRMLLIQTPFMMYPFARRIMADMVRDGGMPPLMIEPIDFAALYQVKMAQAAQQPPAGTA
jgi:preprotein translocase subunit SecB